MGLPGRIAADRHGRGREALRQLALGRARGAVAARHPAHCGRRVLVASPEAVQDAGAGCRPLADDVDLYAASFPCTSADCSRPASAARADNGASRLQWELSFKEFIDATPRSAAGVGLGVWNDSKAQWWETAAGAKAKVAQAIESGVEELAAFRLVPCTLAEGCEHNSAEAPITFWWEALAPFLKPRA